MEIFTSFITTYWYWLVIGLLLVVIIIGLVKILTNRIVGESQTRAYVKVTEERKKSLAGFFDEPDENKAKLLNLTTFKTINLFRSGHILVQTHNRVIKDVTKCLIDMGYTQKMSQEDTYRYLDCNCPVLVIVPLMKIYLFHTDQNEGRQNASAYEVSTKDSRLVCGDVEYILKRLEAENEA